MSPFCPNCGTSINESIRFCPNCGHKIDEYLSPIAPTNYQPTHYEPQQYAPSYQPAPQSSPHQYYPSKEKNTNGIVALVCGLIGLFTPFLISWFFIILAIGFGISGRNNDDSPGMATAGLILGLLGCCCCAIVFIVPYGYYFYY